MSKIIISIILVLTGGAAVFSTVRYNDIVKQNDKLQTELTDISNIVTNLQKKLGGIQKLPNGNNYSPSDYKDLEEERLIKLIDERLSKLLSQNQIDGAQLQQKSSGSGTQQDNQAKNPPLYSDAFKDEVRKAVQEVTREEFPQGRRERREDRTISLLERELALNPAQKEQIQKLFNEQNKAISDIFSKRSEPGFSVDQARQDTEKIRQDTEVKVKMYLDTTQSAKYDQLKAEGRLNTGGDRRGGPQRGGNNTPR